MLVVQQQRQHPHTNLSDTLASLKGTLCVCGLQHRYSGVCKQKSFKKYIILAIIVFLMFAANGNCMNQITAAPLSTTDAVASPTDTLDLALSEFLAFKLGNEGYGINIVRQI